MSKFVKFRQFLIKEKKLKNLTTNQEVSPAAFFKSLRANPFVGNNFSRFFANLLPKNLLNKKKYAKIKKHSVDKIPRKNKFMPMWRLGAPKSLQRFWGDQWLGVPRKFVKIFGVIEATDSRGRRENKMHCFKTNASKIKICRCGGMADATDSKSVEGNFMWVRLPPSAP